MKSYLLLLFTSFLLFLTQNIAAQNITISGKTYDSQNKPLPFVSITEKGTTNGLISTNDGSFKIVVKKIPTTIVFSYIGYETQEYNVKSSSQNLKIFLTETTKNLNEITVNSQYARSKVEEVQIGAEQISMEEMSKIPALFGERDIIKSIQLLPGIKAESDAGAGYQVRGGTASQNLILLDDATVFNAGHLMGFFSAFNDDALTNATLYKGLIPSKFGDATSSVFDISTKSGDFQKYNFGFNVGILSAKFFVNGPAFRSDKVSFFLSARRSYLDIFLKLTDDYKETIMNFYDVNFKINCNLSEKNKLSFTFFRGRDNMGLNDIMDMNWDNTTFSTNYFHEFKSNIYNNFSVMLSDYSSKVATEMLKQTYKMDGFIKKAEIQENFNVNSINNNKLNIGFKAQFINLKSGEWDINYLHQKEVRPATELAAWIGDDYQIGKFMELSAGLRGENFIVMGGKPYYKIDENGEITETINVAKGKSVKNYLMIEPRLSFKFSTSPNYSVKLGYSKTSQNIHAVKNFGMSMPFDRYMMTSNIIKPQIANQVSLGYVREFSQYEFSAETYFKKVENVYDYRDGKMFHSEIEMEKIVLQGDGRAYGAEFLFKKNLGKLTGWIAYTLSWSENKIAGINNNKWYTASNDRRNDISVVAIYKKSDKWEFSSAWVFSTGQALTMPSAKYEVDGVTHYYLAERNGYRAPAYHRLDISATNSKQLKKCERQWIFGIYNLYNHYNPFIITYEEDDTKKSGTKTELIALFGIVPSVAFALKF